MSSAQNHGDGVAHVHAGGIAYAMAVPDAPADHIQGHLLRTGTPYEAGMLERMAAALTLGDVVVDVGANVGNHALYLACVAGAHVVAVEPDPHLAAAVERSAQLNDVAERVEVHSCAAGAARGTGRLARPDVANLGTQTLTASEDEDTCEVPVRTVDDIVGRRPVRMLKIDVEGFEVPVLEGAAATLRRSRPLVWIECLDEPAYRAVAVVLRPLGYRVQDVQNASPTLLFVPGPAGAGAAVDSGVDAALRHMYAERRTADALRGRPQGAAAGGAELETLLADAREELAAAHRRQEELEARLRRDEEDFRVLRDFVAQVEQRLWEARQTQTARETAWERLREVEDALSRAAEEKERAAATAHKARADLRRVRSSRTYRAGRALGDTRTLAGARRVVPRLLSIIRENPKDGDA